MPGKNFGLTQKKDGQVKGEKKRNLFNRYGDGKDQPLKKTVEEGKLEGQDKFAGKLMNL